MPNVVIEFVNRQNSLIASKAEQDRVHGFGKAIEAVPYRYGATQTGPINSDGCASGIIKTSFVIMGGNEHPENLIERVRSAAHGANYSFQVVKHANEIRLVVDTKGPEIPSNSQTNEFQGDMTILPGKPPRHTGISP